MMQKEHSGKNNSGGDDDDEGHDETNNKSTMVSMTEKGLTNTLILLKFPANTQLSLDGCQTNTLMQQEDTIIIRDIPPGFHLLSIRVGGTRKSTDHSENSSHTTTAAMSMMTFGLTLFFSSCCCCCDSCCCCCSASTADSNNHPSISRSRILSNGTSITTSTGTNTTCTNCGEENLIVREYDPKTEEISNGPPDSGTVRNLVKALLDPNQTVLDGRKMIHYDNFTHLQEQSQVQQSQVQQSQGCRSWSSCLTNYITYKVLKRHGLQGRGDKIVPTFASWTSTSSMDSWEDKNVHSDANPGRGRTSQEDIQDGVSLQYAPIPIPPSISHRDPSMKVQSHVGTRRYLSSLTPSQRTEFFLGFSRARDRRSTSKTYSADDLFESVLKEYYENDWELLLGEFQLSFVVFVCCSCLASLEHWRDVLCMVSECGPNLGSNGQQRNYKKFFICLVKTVKCQWEQFDSSIFQEDEYTRGNDLMPAMERIANTCLKWSSQQQSESMDCWHTQEKECKELSAVAKELLDTLRNNTNGKKYGSHHHHHQQHDSIYNEENDDNDSICVNHDMNREIRSGNSSLPLMDIDYEDTENDSESEDGPICVAMEEVQASMERNASFYPHSHGSGMSHDRQVDETSKKYQEQFPFLFAAREEDEDVVMTCARILDEQRDVTLVREAAAYLEQVEAHRKG